MLMPPWINLATKHRMTHHDNLKSFPGIQCYDFVRLVGRMNADSQVFPKEFEDSIANQYCDVVCHKIRTGRGGTRHNTNKKIMTSWVGTASKTGTKATRTLFAYLLLRPTY
eukprot:scaffold22356_cov53-Attheya_sp.AAC.1